MWYIFWNKKVWCSGVCLFRDNGRIIDGTFWRRGKCIKKWYCRRDSRNEYENGIEGEGKQEEGNLYVEQEIVEINGHCIVIEYDEYGEKTNKIESIK